MQTFKKLPTIEPKIKLKIYIRLFVIFSCSCPTQPSVERPMGAFENADESAATNHIFSGT
ncbi:MAG: hypothetical protein HZB80_02265 [Deltaproteobacteria bacterium]|nr:hypothetical protein [Deltaproteobacteria bacterium]